jgi:Trk-type K+ transport system membrane component
MPRSIPRRPYGDHKTAKDRKTPRRTKITTKPKEVEPTQIENEEHLPEQHDRALTVLVMVVVVIVFVLLLQL